MKQDHAAFKGKTGDNGDKAPPSNFIEHIVREDLRTGKHRKVTTRFPPEPNGYLHIGHAKSICLNFGIARDFGGVCHLRFDDTNPHKEDVEYVDAIADDVRWLGFEWGDHFYFASDYYEKLYAYAVELIKRGRAYVCSLTPEEVRQYRGTLTEPGQDSPYRARPIEENLDLFERMRAGEFPDGSHVLRAKIDMASPNLNMRDPAIYRIRHASHHRTGNAWCIYPMYDFTHCLSDSIEGITHSLCTLEFQDHRPLYDWVLDQLETPCHPQQIEFARLNLSHTVMSKRKLLELVKGGYVTGWDDPRMPTISGLRRRGFTPEAIRDFCDRIGVAKADSMVDIALLEHCLRDDLNRRAPRLMAVLNPLKVVIDNYPEGKVETLDCPFFPEEPEKGTRPVPFSRELFIERDDFREEAPKKWFRFAPGREVRLRYAYYVTVQAVVKNPETGRVEVLHCTYDPETKGGWSKDGRKVKGTAHWVSAAHAVPATVRLYAHLFDAKNPAELGDDWKSHINPESLCVLDDARVEPSLAEVPPETRVQFERQGYFCADRKEHTPQRPIFNRTVTLRDTWAKIEAAMQRAGGAA